MYGIMRATVTSVITEKALYTGLCVRAGITAVYSLIL